MKRTYCYVVLFALIIVVSATIPSPAQAAPTLRTDQPLYTLRDKQVTLVGSGFSVNQIYYVWTKGPFDNATHISGTSFTPVSGGLVPPATSLPISSDSPLGTYLVSVSTSASSDNSQARTHYGMWGSMKPLYERTQSVKIVGGGLFPGTSFRLTIRNPAGNFVHQATLVSSASGDFNHTWRIPEDAITSEHSVFIDGTGTFDDAQQDYVSASKFTVTQAVLSVKIVEQPSSSYQRTEKAKISLALKYSDGSPVVRSRSDIRPIVLLLNQSTVAFASISLLDAANGVWRAESKILVNSTPSARYRFELSAMSFDDGFGNKGGAVDTLSNYFQVRNASFVITSELNGTQIQIPFGQVSIISKVAYPDGTPLTNGTVRVLVSTGSSTSDLKSVYDSRIRAWRASYSSTLSDLWRVGTWTLRVEAYDVYGNSGTATYEVAAQPYLFLASIAVLIVVVLFGRWTVSRYGRKVYFRIRKITQRFRGQTFGMILLEDSACVAVHREFLWFAVPFKTEKVNRHQILR